MRSSPSAVAATPVLHLTVIDGSEIGSLRVTNVLTRVGRDTSNDVLLRDKYISSRHAEIELVGERIRLRDLRSTNGTRVRRHRWVFPVDHRCSHEAWLEDGDEILLGQPSQQVLIRLSVIRSPSDPGAADPDGATIVESVSCRSVPDVAERLGRGTLTALQSLAMRLKPKDEPKALVSALAESILDLLPNATHVSISLLDEASGAYVPALGMSRAGPEPECRISETVSRQVLDRGAGVLFVGNQSRSLQEAAIHCGLCVPIFTGDRTPGLIQVDRRGVMDGGFTSRDLGLLVVAANQAGLVLELSLMHAALRTTVERALSGVVSVMESRDGYTCGHAQAVTDLSRRMAQRLALGDGEVSVIARAAALHDVGRFAVPTHILQKPGPLTQAEWDAVKAEPELGASLLQRCSVLQDLIPIVRHVHEHWDGTGHPAGLRGDDIPLGARIVAIADAFHSLVSHRAHRAAMDEAEALREIARCAGSQFDPRLVGVLEEIVARANESWSDDHPTVIGWEIDPSGRVPS